MNEYLIAPDGTALLSQEEEFVRVAARISNDKYKHLEGWQEYSNANYIFLGLVLEALTGRPLWLLVKEVVFDRMSLQETTFDIRALRDLESQRILVEGFRISSDGARSPVDQFNHLDGVVQYAALGLRSSPRDLAKFNREILLALDNESQCGLEPEDAIELLKGQPISPYGYYTEFGSDTYSESPNQHLLADSYVPDQLGEPRSGTTLVAYRKAGYIDGFGCNVVLLPERRISIIVLGNSSGPIDTTLHISNLLLQEALNLSNPIDISRSAIEEGKVCRQSIGQIEKPDDIPTQIPPRPTQDLVGTYQHERYEQQIKIEQDGSVTFRSGTRSSSEMSLVYLNDSTVILRPGAKGWGIETWSVWRDLKFHVQTVQNSLALVRPGAEYAYKRL